MDNFWRTISKTQLGLQRIALYLSNVLGQHVSYTHLMFLLLMAPYLVPHLTFRAQYESRLKRENSPKSRRLLKAAVGNFCKNVFFTNLLKVSLCPDSMRQIICEKSGSSGSFLWSYCQWQKYTAQKQPIR
ncbi:hypothetical protein AMECASPLE_037113, partial [Ameca splendens]